MTKRINLTTKEVIFTLTGVKMTILVNDHVIVFRQRTDLQQGIIIVHKFLKIVYRQVIDITFEINIDEIFDFIVSNYPELIEGTDNNE